MIFQYPHAFNIVALHSSECVDVILVFNKFFFNFTKSFGFLQVIFVP